MDAETKEILAYFRQNIHNVAQLGHEWGLKEEEIQACIMKALSIKAEDLSTSDFDPTIIDQTRHRLKSPTNLIKVKSCIRIISTLFGSFILAIIVVNLAMYNKFVEHHVQRSLAELDYPIMSGFRMFATAIHKLEAIDIYKGMLFRHLSSYSNLATIWRLTSLA